jgi:hypothetical protein
VPEVKPTLPVTFHHSNLYSPSNKLPLALRERVGVREILSSLKNHPLRPPSFFKPSLNVFNLLQTFNKLLLALRERVGVREAMSAAKA